MPIDLEAAQSPAQRPRAPRRIGASPARRGARDLAASSRARPARPCLRTPAAAARQGRLRRTTATHPCSDPGHGRRSYRRSQASPAASTVSSVGATNCMFPIARPAQPIRLTQRRNDESGSRTSSSLASSGGSSTAIARADVEVDLGLVGRQLVDRTVGRRDVVGADPAAPPRAWPHHVARTRRRAAGNVSRWLSRRLVQEQRPHVRAPRPGSPPRRPARRAARGRPPTPLPRRSPRSRRPSPRSGAWRSRPTVSPSSRGSGTGRPGEHRPEEGDVRDATAPSGRRCRGGAEREDAVERDRPQRDFSPTVSQAAEGAGSSSRCRCRCRGRRGRRRAPPRCRTRASRRLPRMGGL